MSRIFDFAFKIINPESLGNIAEEVKDCAQQLGSVYSRLNSKAIIVRANWFYRKTTNSTCAQFQNVIFDAMELEGVGHIPFTIVSEKPVGEASVQLVICLITNFSGQVVAKGINLVDRVYCQVKYLNQKWLFTGGAGCSEEKLSTRNSAHQAFREIKAILENENYSFQNLVRQWNYVPEITIKETDNKGMPFQNYQEFNDVRAAWYLKEGLDKDFPASTGIGVYSRGVNIEVIALDPGSDLHIKSLHNPEQSDAHQYSSSKLVGEKAVEAPRFERGKMVFDDGNGHIWVSGTASILGENSVDGDIQEQTSVTLNNIDRLLKPENLIHNGLPWQSISVNALYIRAYVKHRQDGEWVESRLKEKYPGAVRHVLEADICRPELLIEIEGEFSISQLAN